MSSEDGRLKMRKRISVEKQLEFSSSPNSKKPRESAPAPDGFDRESSPAPDDVDLSDVGEGFCDETETRECAAIALSCWNQKSLSKKEPEYELVEALGCRRMVGPTTYHCNFTARLKNASEAENMLFFAELKYSKHFAKEGEDAALGCRFCCILGPTGTETGSYGCGICFFHRDPIHHPPYSTNITKGRTFSLLGYLMRNRRSVSRLPPIMQPIHCSLPPPDNVLRHYVNIALSSWNERSLSEQGPEYKVVDVLECKRNDRPFIYHCNFIARPKNGSEAESMLFFMEAKCGGNIGRMSCTAFLLGPSDIKTGLRGCKFCDSDPILIQHPENGEFLNGENGSWDFKNRGISSTETGRSGRSI